VDTGFRRYERKLAFSKISDRLLSDSPFIPKKMKGLAISSPLEAKIAHARELSTQPRSHKMVEFQSIGQLLEARAQSFPDKVFLIYYDRDGNRSELTYKALLTIVKDRVGILTQHGVNTGDRVATYAGNYPETVITYLACWYYGCTVVPLSVSEDDPHLRFIIVNSQVKMIFTRPDLVDGLKRILNGGEEVIDRKVWIEPIDNTDISAQYNEITDFEVTSETEALIVYTSGTTGNPKGVILDQYNLMVDASALAEHHEITVDARMMCVLPIHHVNGTIVTLLTPLMAGSSVVLNERFSVTTFFPLLARESVRVVSVVPTLLAFLLEANASVEGLDLCLHHIICGAGPLTVDLAMRFEQKYGIPIAHGYGLSETTCYSCCLPVAQNLIEHRKWMSEYGYPSIGPALAVNEMAIHDTEGKPLGEGVKGEIVIRGHNVMKGYFANESANSVAFEFGWFRSGDEGFWLPDENGVPYYFITGRIKELIIRGGVNIAPLEIDEVMMSLPGIRAGISVGFPHDLYGEEVGAYVVREAGSELTADDIIAACKERLPFQKVPKVVLFGDRMPVTSTGKYQRNKLKGLFAEWQNSRFK